RDPLDLDARARLEERLDFDQRHRGKVPAHAAAVPRADQLAGGLVFRAVEHVNRQLADRRRVAAGFGDDRHQVGERLVELFLEAIADDSAGRVPSDLAGEKHDGTAGTVRHAVAVAGGGGERHRIHICGGHVRRNWFLHRIYAITSPPSTPYACPVMADASGSTRNRTTAATSSGRIRRPSGFIDSSARRASA